MAGQHDNTLPTNLTAAHDNVILPTKNVYTLTPKQKWVSHCIKDDRVLLQVDNVTTSPHLTHTHTQTGNRPLSCEHFPWIWQTATSFSGMLLHGCDVINKVMAVKKISSLTYWHAFRYSPTNKQQWQLHDVSYVEMVLDNSTQSANHDNSTTAYMDNTPIGPYSSTDMLQPCYSCSFV
jgi:hypothetical protein